MKTLIFTDLDGTFLNHDDYSFEDSFDALKKIKQKKIPLIFTTSKTKSEVIQLQQKVGIVEPFIIENGAALFIPQGYQGLNLNDLTTYDGYKSLIFGIKYNEILKFYETYKDKFGMRGFSDMSLDEVMNLTGLDANSATLSRQRDFSEPFIVKNNSMIDDLNKLAYENGMKITQGGRFFHLIGLNQDKGIAVKKTSELFSKLFVQDILSIGLGDGINDIAMFENVDKPIVIKNHYGEYVKSDIDSIQLSSHKGSAGFNEMVLKNVS